MTEPDFSHLAALHALGDDSVPQVVLTLAGDRPADLIWRSELGGLTFRINDQFVKWNPRHTGIDLERERDRLAWLSGRHPAPRVIAYGSDEGAQWRSGNSSPDIDLAQPASRAPAVAAKWSAWDHSAACGCLDGRMRPISAPTPAVPSPSTSRNAAS